MTCSCVSIGALQRDNPLPPGRYWIDVFGEDLQSQFSRWNLDNASSVRVVAVEHFEAIGGFKSRDWILFDVSLPTDWDAVMFGFPNIVIGDEIQTSDDTVQKPPDKPNWWENPELLSGPTIPLIGGAVVLTGILLVVSLRK